MSNAIWGDLNPTSDEVYPLKLLKGLVQDLLKQVSAYGACLALYDESTNQMVVRLHLRLCETGENSGARVAEQGNSQVRPPLRRNTMKLADRQTPLPDISTSTFPPEAHFEEVEAVDKMALLPVGSTHTLGQDLIGATWYQNQSYHLSHERYQAWRANAHQPPVQEEFALSWYLTLPLKEPAQVAYEDVDRKHPQNHCLGVLVLYQIQPCAGFQAQQSLVAQQHAERISLYLQNDRLRRLQLYTRDHVKHLQQISTTFPNSLRLSELVEEISRFVHHTVDVSSMLLTLYDRDTRKLYDIFALNHGQLIEGLTERPAIIEPEKRPHWWQIAQREKRTLLLLDARKQNEGGAYADLLTGTWGDQKSAETLLLIPMKMFTRVVGSLCITSQRSQAYSPLEILVLETMVQIITVALENAKLYERPRLALKQSKRREESLASTVSALQAISTVLDVDELLHRFVQIVANLVQAEMCSFFQLMPDADELVAQAIFDRTGKWHAYDGVRRSDKDDHEELIKMIRLPFTGSLLAELVNEGFFYLDATNIEVIAQASAESGAIFLRETDTQRMLVIPVRYQTTDVVGIVAVHMSQADRIFQPEEISILMAIS
ncbi:MAG: GAF domain-containing protein, partial [Ktedonobacteraceae bacterium]